MARDNKKKLQEKDFVDEEGRIVRRRKRKRKTIGEEGSRKQTAVGLLVILVLSLMFYLPKEFKNWWNKWNEPETVTIVKPVGDKKDVSEVDRVGWRLVRSVGLGRSFEMKK